MLPIMLILGWPLTFILVHTKQSAEVREAHALLESLQPASELLKDCDFTPCDVSLQEGSGNNPEGIDSLGVQRNASKNGA